MDAEEISDGHVAGACTLSSVISIMNRCEKSERTRKNFQIAVVENKRSGGPLLESRSGRCNSY